jgi:hypothetical protein
MNLPEKQLGSSQNLQVILALEMFELGIFLKSIAILVDLLAGDVIISPSQKNKLWTKSGK